MRLAAMAGRHQQPGTEDKPFQAVFLENIFMYFAQLFVFE
jgi:hypothetical protein